MNILILSCGTRNLLIRYFKENGFEKVVGTDCSEFAPALFEATSYHIVPRMTDINYLPTILDICAQEKIQAVLPLQEDELALIANNKDIFLSHDITPIVSDIEAIDLCRNKFLFYKHLIANNLPALPTVDSFESFTEARENGYMDLPVFMKPTSGCGSVGISKFNNIDLLKTLCTYCEEPYILQNFANGEEFGADIYVDILTRKITSIFVKKKLRMRAGETEKSVSFIDCELFDLIEKTISTLPLYGPIDMDLFCIDGKYYISEINPRFGGGYPHAYNCGINFPLNIKKNIEGIETVPEIGKYKSDQYMFKYTDLIMR